MGWDYRWRVTRSDEILEVLVTEFGPLMSAEPAAFRRKFRKMASSAFAFYRGSACLFYADMVGEFASTRFLDDQTSRVWIHGDLHAENFGTYMIADGVLVFNVNDFDEAYVGPYLWDLRRFVASVALIGYAKALSVEKLVTWRRTLTIGEGSQLGLPRRHTAGVSVPCPDSPFFPESAHANPFVSTIDARENSSEREDSRTTVVLHTPVHMSWIC